MLTSLHIENYALIQQSDITFDSGFVAITGETGAGKSIMLGALGLLLGQRADLAVLADKERKCVVEAQFDISGLELNSLFEAEDIDYDDLLVLRREILPSGRSRAFANDCPVQLPFLRSLASRIIDIHSQHQTLTLADSDFRLSLLDTLGAKEASEEYTKVYTTYSQLKHKLEQLTFEEAQNRKDADYLQFQFNELNEACLQSEEQVELEQESQLLAHAEAIREGIATAASAFDDDTELALLARLRQAKNALSHVASYHPSIDGLLGRVDSSLIELDDIYYELQNVAESINYSPERQQQVDERLSLLYRLEKKHGVQTVNELIALRDEFDARLQSILSLDERIHDLMEQVDRTFDSVQKTADRLTEARRKAGDMLASNIIPTLHDLGMPEARFRVELVQQPVYGPTGHDCVQFLFNANRGGELRDLSKVASGGELSRLMLAIKSMLTTHLLLPTVVFDEIDSGVSGDISVSVGNIMRLMAAHMQVIAITHLPQIAAKADQHLKVAKGIEADRTVSRIRELDSDERVNEIAVMLSSNPPTLAALQTARELMSISNV